MNPNLKRPSLALLLLAVLLGTPSISVAQQDSARRAAPSDSARLAGIARSSLNGQPLQGVMITVIGTHRFDVTDSTGAFALTGLPSGQRTVRILFGERLSYDKEIQLKRAQTLVLAIMLDVQAYDLSPVVVEARSLFGERSLAGFYDRKRTGWGRFYTYDDFERRASRSLRTLLMETGVTVRCGFSSCVPITLEGGRLCLLSLYLDGMQLQPQDIEFFYTDELAGVEVYRHAVDIPVPVGLQRLRGRGDVESAVAAYRAGVQRTFVVLTTGAPSSCSCGRYKINRARCQMLRG